MEELKILRAAIRLRSDLRKAKTADEAWQVLEAAKRLSRKSDRHPEVVEVQAAAKERYNQLKQQQL